MLVRELGSRGYRTQEAADGRTALERWEAGRPDVILLDLGPAGHGWAGGHPADPARRHDADRDPVGAVRGAREGRGARPWRRRLRDQAVRARGAPRPPARGHPALDRAWRATPPGRSRSARSSSTPARTASAWATGPSTSRRASSSCCASFLGEQGRVVTKGKLLRAVWGQAYQGEDSYVYVHVSQLRHKLAAADPNGELRT